MTRMDSIESESYRKPVWTELLGESLSGRRSGSRVHVEELVEVVYGSLTNRVTWSDRWSRWTDQ